MTLKALPPEAAWTGLVRPIVGVQDPPAIQMTTVGYVM